MNAKKEFLEEVQDKKVKCAWIGGPERYNQFTNSFRSDKIFLKINYSEDDYEEFLKSLNYEYDNGYGGQQLFGIIWYEDGTWSSRGEYDGSEWWKYNKCPEIDQNCL